MRRWFLPHARQALACACLAGAMAGWISAPARAADPFIVLDTLGATTPATTFSVFGASGPSLLSSQLAGPRFMLLERTVISEIGAFVNVCESIIGGIPQCPATQPMTVQIRREVAGAPDPSAVLASFVLSHDDDSLTVSYELATPEYALDAGTYFAIFAPQGADAGFLLAGASSPFPYRAGLTFIGFVYPGIGSEPASEQFAAVRILGRPAAKTPLEELDELSGRLGDAGPGRSLAAKARAARAALTRGRLEAACGAIGALAHEARAQSQASLPEPLAADVVATAERMSAALGC